MLIAATAIAVPRPSLSADPPQLSLLLIDGFGNVLDERLGDEPRVAPGLASLLTALMTLEQVGLGLFPIDVPVVASPVAVGVPGAILRLDPEATYRLEELLRAIIVADAKDATMAVVELICSTAHACRELMQRRALDLGMGRTAIGGPMDDPRRAPDQSTVRDAALLVLALLEHPETLRWASQRGFPFDGGPVLANKNALIGAVPDVDGLQATRDGEHCSTIATAERSGTRLVALAMGVGTLESCSRAAWRLLESGFESFEQIEVVRAGESLRHSIEIVDGTVERLVPVAAGSYAYSRRRGVRDADSVVIRYQIPTRLQAPIEPNDLVGEIIVERDGRVEAIIPARSPQRVVRRGLF